MLLQKVSSVLLSVNLCRIKKPRVALKYMKMALKLEKNDTKGSLVLSLELKKYINDNFSNSFGIIDNFYYPCTHNDAIKHFKYFINYHSYLGIDFIIG